MRLAPVTSLNGTWRMQPEKIGLDRPKTKKWCEVPVPMPWTAFLSPSFGVRPQMIPTRMAWYRRVIIVPDIPPLSRLALHFEAVNFFAVVFVNGERCGQHVGDAIPFHIDITDFVTPHEQAEILVGVQDMSYAEVTEDGAPRRRAARKLIYPGLAHHPGIWGGVSLRIVPELHIVGVRVTTTLPVNRRGRIGLDEGRIRVAVTVRNGTGRALGFSLTNEVYDGARQATACVPIRGVVGAGEVTEIDMGTVWDSATLWWPDYPHLYTLRTALWSTLPNGPGDESPEFIGDVVDRIHTPLGFREFRLEGDTFKLNNIPIQLRSESLCPVSGQLFGEMRSGTPSSPIAPEQAREVLAALKRERGLNAVRFHRLPPSPALLDAADEVGLLVIVELPLPDDEQRYAVDNPRFWVNTAELARKWVSARVHHPSVVMWSIDQGMVRRYGKRVVHGLQSLARTVAEVDPTRPVENSGDADLVDTGEVLVPGPLSVPFPAAGVAFRDAGPYAPEAIRGRVWPALDPPPGPWLPERPAERPLCMMEHSRRALTPNSLAFFLGDAAYAPKVDLAESAASLAMLEIGACRMAGLAGIHTIGRPSSPPGTGDMAGELAALSTELFANFYAGTRFVQNLVLRNDTRFDQDCDLVCQVTTAEGGVTHCDEQLLLAAGSEKKKPVAFELPDIGDVRDPANANSMLAEFSVELTGTRVGKFEHRRKIAIWPRVRAAGARRIGLYDPDGRTAAALSAVGAEYSAAHGAPHGEFDTIIIGENALAPGLPPDADAIRAFVAEGGLAIVLAQSDLPYDLTPVTTILDEGRGASITFVRDGEHRVLRGLSSFEMRWWQNDHRVAAGLLRKPALGNFRCLADAGGPGGLRWAAALEVFHGKGSYILTQMDLVEKAARAPIAGLLLARLADAAPSWTPVSAKMLADARAFRRIGANAPPLPEDFSAGGLEMVQAVLFTGACLSRLAKAQLRALRNWVQHGGCLYVHNVAPDHASALAAVAGQHVKITESPRERLVLNRPGYGLARGLSSADLYFTDHGARYLGEVPLRMYAATAVATAKGDVTGVASTAESPLEYGLLMLHAGRGRVVVDQVRWDVQTAADSRAGRYISTLLTNLGVRLAPPPAVLRSDQCELVDISAACNTSLTDPIPGDGEGWTDRGPDNDLSAFTPGLLIAAGVPYRVTSAPSDPGRNCCVLGPDGDPTSPRVEIGRAVRHLAFLIACEGHVKHGRPVAHFTVQYRNGLETQIPLRYGLDVIDWNERGRKLDYAAVAWKGFTSLGEPAAIYAKRWRNNRPADPVKSVAFSSTRAGATPILLALTAVL